MSARIQFDKLHVIITTTAAHFYEGNPDTQPKAVRVYTMPLPMDHEPGKHLNLGPLWGAALTVGEITS